MPICTKNPLFSLISLYKFIWFVKHVLRRVDLAWERDVSSRSEITRIRYNIEGIRDADCKFCSICPHCPNSYLIPHFICYQEAILQNWTSQVFQKFSIQYLHTFQPGFQSKLQVSKFFIHWSISRLILGTTQCIFLFIWNFQICGWKKHFLKETEHIFFSRLAKDLSISVQIILLNTNRNWMYLVTLKKTSIIMIWHLWIVPYSHYCPVFLHHCHLVFKLLHLPSANVPYSVLNSRCQE